MGMLKHLSRITLIAAFIAATSACALTTTSISDLKNHPGRYQDRTVRIDGVVTDSVGLPFIPFRFYKVDDGTGELTVLSQGTRMPAKGEHVRVKGRVNDVAVLGGQAVGLHLREEDLSVKRR